MAPHSAMVSSQNINEEADHDTGNWDEVVGIKFKPTDEILIRDYLVNKMSRSNGGPIFPLIKEVDVYEQEPSKLRSVAHDFGDGNMYFFSPVQKKYRKGTSFERKAGDGCWKKSKAPSDVCDENHNVIGTKTSLVYHKHDPIRKVTIKTQWLMKEYMLPEGQNDEPTKMTLCVVYYHDKTRKQRDCDVEEPEGFAAAAATEDEKINPGKRQHHSSCTSNNTPPLHGSSSPVPGATLEQSLPYDPNCCQNTPNMMNGFWGAPAANHYAPVHSNSSPVAARPLEQSLPSDPNYFHNRPNMMNGSWGAPTPNCYPPLHSSSSPIVATILEHSLPFDPNYYHNMPNMMNGSRDALTPNCYPPLHSSSSPIVATTLEQSLPSDPNNYQNTPNMMNGSWGALAPNYYPQLHSSTSLVATNLDQSLPSDPSYSNDYQNMENMMNGSWSATDQHHITYSNPDLLIEESGVSLNKFFIEFPNNPHSQTLLDQFENNTITQNISVNNNKDPSCLNSAEHLRYPGSKVAFCE